jgi:hypothetical protein
MKLLPVLALGSFVALTACSSTTTGTGGGGGSAFDSLFSAPKNATATAGDVHGVWGGSTSIDGITFDYRFKFENTAITLANRCKFPDGTSLTTGATAAARVTDHDVTMLESKSDHEVNGSDRCNVDLKPGAYPYAIDGLSLTLTGPDESTLKMVKISD